MTSPNRSTEKCTNLKRNGPSFRKVAERVQEWNRAIPESNYITLGTIRYGVRPSPGPLSLGLTATGGPATSIGGLHGEDQTRTQQSPSSPDGENESFQRFSTTSNFSSALDTCCCLGTTSTLNSPWNTHSTHHSVGNNRTKLPIPTANCCSGAATKNRTQSSAATQASLNSSSRSLLSLAVSSAPTTTPLHTSRSHSVLFTSEESCAGRRADHAEDRQTADLTQADESCRLGPVGEPVVLEKRDMMPQIVTTSTTPSAVSHTEVVSGDRPTHGKHSGCACCQNASRNSSDATNGSVGNISTTNANTTARSSCGEIGCCCELNTGSSRSVSVGQFCELPSQAHRKCSKSQSDSTLSASSPSSSTVCCYSIAESSKKVSKSVHRGTQQSPPNKRFPRAIVQQDSVEKVIQSPPIPPPRPRPKNSVPAGIDLSATNENDQPPVASNSRSGHRRDPINFRRKLQHFESYRKNGDRHSDEGSNGIGCGDHIVGSGFELLSCFSGGPVSVENYSRKASCYSPNNSEISYSGSSSKSEPHLNIHNTKPQLKYSNSNFNVLTAQNGHNLDRPPVSVSRNNSHPTIRKVIVPNLEKLFNDPSNATPTKNETSSLFYRKLAPHLTKKSFLPHRRDIGHRGNEQRPPDDPSQVLSQHDARSDRSEDRLIPISSADRSRVGHAVEEVPCPRSEPSELSVLNAINKTNSGHNDNDRVRATLVEIVDDDDEDVIESVDNDDEFIDYDVDHDDDVDSEICFIDSSQSDIDLIGSLTSHFSSLSGNGRSHAPRYVLSEPILPGATVLQQFSRPIKLSSFNTNNLCFSDKPVPNSSLVNDSSQRPENINNSTGNSSHRLTATNLQNNSIASSNSSVLRNRSDINFTIRPAPGSDGSGSLCDKYNLCSTFRVAEIDEDNQNLSYSNLNLYSELNKVKNGCESYESFIEIESIPEERIVPRIDRSQSFDSYKKHIPSPLSSSVSRTGIVSSSSGQLASPISSSSPTSPPFFTCTSGTDSPFASTLLIYTSQQLPVGGNTNNKGPYTVGRRVSSSDSFGNYTRNQLHASSIISPDTGSIMEKRRNTLDRLQRLRFGRKSSPSPTPSQQDKSSTSSSSASSRKGNEKSEVLKELTERLKGNRLSPTPPPIPPPRKPRQHNSLEKPSHSTENSPLASTVFGSDDILAMDADEEKLHDGEVNPNNDLPSPATPATSVIPIPPPPPPPPPPPMPPFLLSAQHSLPTPASTSPKSSLYETLRPNTSVSNLESLILRGKSRDDVKSAPTSVVKEEDLFKELPRAESRILVGAYAQKSIPFRSISFSQIDFSSSGKYVRSSLSALRDKWKRDKDKENSEEDKANPTSENKSESGSINVKHSVPTTEVSSPNGTIRYEPTFNHIKEQDNERMSLEEIVNPPEIILEEDSNTAENETQDDVKDVLSNSSDSSAEIALEATEMKDEQLPESIAANYVDASTPTLATLTEEEMPLEPPPENIFQTATTCMIPVPVYECSAREWGMPTVDQQWINAEQVEINMSPEALEPLPDHLGKITDPSTSILVHEMKSEETSATHNTMPDLLHTEQNPVPLISVSLDTNSQSDSTPDERSSEEKIVEFPEVRKRYSNDELKDAPTPRGNSIEEKRRIDKSRRRKGMYIQWPTINKHGVIEHDEWEEDSPAESNGENKASPKSKGNGGVHLDFSKIKINAGSDVERSTPISINCKSPEDLRTPGSLYSSCDPATPDSEVGKPVWPKAESATSSRRASLSLQSSEEKDDVPAASTPSSHKSPPNRHLMFLRSDSISDNENDQRSRDRASPSPAPGDHDYKRYSKRPLRGPYGQMLEAEMKKPGRMHYDEILEDLKSTESLNTLSPPNRNRDAGNLSFDETANRQQKSSRSRKGSAHLPVPAHTRAASTPSQMENTTTTASINSISPQHKRCQSTLDTTSMDRIPSTGHLKEGGSTKKLSVDRERSPKRASSEALEVKHQNAKRSASTASDKQPKRSLDEMRLSSRTPSERSMVESTKSSTNLLPTPELLAELLKGSSERLVAEQRQQMFAITSKWFTLASPLYTKRRNKMSNATPTPPPPPPPSSIVNSTPPTITSPLAGFLSNATTNTSSNNNNNSNNNTNASSNNNRQKLRLSLFDIQHSNLNSSCDNPSSQDEMPNTNDGSSESSVRKRTDKLQKMPSSTYSDSEDDAERKSQIDSNNRWNVSDEGDTRTHIVQEIFQNEQSYVEDLQTVIVKYLNVLKTPEYAGMIDSKTVDDIFFMVPEILSIHERFLNELRRRLEGWEPQQKVGDAFVEAFSKTDVLETYTLFVNNCNRAKDAIRMTCQARPSFSRFLQNTSREHKGKLTLDNLLIKPVQKFPNYELLFRRLIKHTDIDHPDQKPLQDALKLAHDILLHINAKKKEGQENGQREAALRELEGVIEGVSDLVAIDRQFLALDVVSMPNGQGARKERGFFLFSDLLVITSIKRRSGTIRKPNTTVCPGSVASTLDTNKYKFLMKIPLDNTEIVKSKDESVRKMMTEIDQLVDDCNKIQQISKIVSSLRYPHQHLEETLKDLHREIDSQLKELKSQDNQLNMLELTFQLPNGIQNISVAFSKPETRSQWEENFNEAKQKLAASLERHPIPEFLTSIPIRKTRAGLQFTCAAPTLSSQKDVWVCNSDGYVGQVCVLSLFPEPTVTSCNGVCNARILCVASVPACSDLIDQHSVSSSSNSETPRSSRNSNSSTSADKKPTKSKSDADSDIKLDSSSSSSDSEIDNQERPPSPTPAVSAHHQHQDSSDDTDGLQSTMWLGTEDGCIHVYNCTDNIRIKKNKIKIQHVSAVYSILYLDNRVFVSLANGDICVYLRDSSGWNTTSPHCLPIGSVTSPVNRLLNVQGKLWCSIQGIIKVLDTKTLQVENQIQISSDSKPITNMAVSAHYVWISIQNSAHIKCFHSNSYEQIFEVNLAPSVNKMLSNCDDIIRQHKAACLRVTSLLACKDLIWIGTSAGVLLTIPSQGYSKTGGSMNNIPVVTGIPHGHTGHVRFLTYVETETPANGGSGDENGSIGYGTTERKNKRNSTQSKSKPDTGNVLIISGGDGYEDFRSSGTNTMSEVAGREDSTNHLLLWQM